MKTHEFIRVSLSIIQGWAEFFWNLFNFIKKNMWSILESVFHTQLSWDNLPLFLFNVSLILSHSLDSGPERLAGFDHLWDFHVGRVNRFWFHARLRSKTV